MDTRSLEMLARQCMKKTRLHFFGVRSAHALPEVVCANDCFIVNTHTYRGPGQHWVVFYFNEQKNGFFFDSFGDSPARNGHVEWGDYLQKQSSDFWSYNKHPLQKFGTSTCGQYCLLFLHWRARLPHLTNEGLILRLMYKNRLLLPCHSLRAWQANDKDNVIDRDVNEVKAVY